MSKRVVGLDIGTSAVRAVELSVGSGRPVLLAFGQVTLPRGAVVDGEVLDLHAVTDALRRLWKQGGFRQKRVSVSIAGLRAITRELEIAQVPDEEVNGAVRFQANELIPFPVDQTVLSSQVLGTYLNADSEPMMHVLVAAAHEELVHGVVTAILDAGLIPESVDLASSAIVRAVVGPQPQPGPEAIVSVGAGITIVTVHRYGVPDFVRTIGQGGNTATDAIASTLGVPTTDAEALKRRIGEPFANMGQVEAATQDTVGVLVGEIRSSLDFYASLQGRSPIGHVVLTGGGARLPGLGARLEGQVGIPVSYASPLSHLDVSRIDLDEAEVAVIDSLMSVPVGCALPEVGLSTRKFNLLPDEVHERLREQRIRRNVVTGVAAVVVLLALLTGLRYYQVHNTQAQVASAKESIAFLNGQVTRYDDVVQTNLQIHAAQARVLSAVSGEVSWPTVMDQLAGNIPSDVYLTSLTGNAATTPGSGSTATPSGAATPSGSATAGTSSAIATLQIEANATQYPGGSQWITQIDGSPVFANTYITSISSGASSGSSTPGGGPVTFSSTVSVTSAAHSSRIGQFSGTSS